MLIPGRMYKRVTDNVGGLWIKEKLYKAADHHLMNSEGNPRWCYECNFELQPETHTDAFYLSIAKSKEHKEKQMDYQFSVSSDKLISTYEIQDSLTRQHPMAIVHRSDGMHTVVLHDSIMDKLVVCSKDIIDQFFEAMEPYDVSPDGYVPTTGGCLTPIVKAVRAVRNAKIVVGKPCDVKVVFPEI